MGIFLIVSELSLWPGYYAKHWPLLSPASGFVFLGLTMIILGFNTLGNLNKSATSVEILGKPLWNLVIASGILSPLIGLLNIIAVCLNTLLIQFQEPSSQFSRPIATANLKMA